MTVRARGSLEIDIDTPQILRESAAALSTDDINTLLRGLSPEQRLHVFKVAGSRMNPARSKAPMGRVLRAAMRGLSEGDLEHTLVHLLEPVIHQCDLEIGPEADDVSPQDVSRVVQPLVDDHGVPAVRATLAVLLSTAKGPQVESVRSALLSDGSLRLPEWPAVDSLEATLPWLRESLALVDAAYAEASAEALPQLQEALEKKTDPFEPLDQMNELTFRFHAVMGALEAALEAEQSSHVVESSMDGLVDALDVLERLQADRAGKGALNELRGAVEALDSLAGPEHYLEQLAHLRAQVEAVLDAWPPQDEASTDLAEGLAALTRLAHATADDAPDRVIDGLTDQIREQLPSELAALALPVGRGRVAFVRPDDNDAGPATPTTEDAVAASASSAPDGAGDGDGVPAESESLEESKVAVSLDEPASIEPLASELDRAGDPGAEDDEAAEERVVELTAPHAVPLPERQSDDAVPVIAPEALSSSDPSPEVAIDGDALRRELLDQRRFGLAYWLERSWQGDTARSQVLRLLALSSGIVRSTGECAAACRSEFEVFEPDALDGDPGFQILALVAAVRTALRAPYSKASNVLQESAAILVRDPSALAFLQQLAMVTRSGLFVGADIATIADGQDELEAELADVRRRATAALEDWPHRRVKYHAATVVWKHWLTGSGVLRSLLEVAAQDRRALLDETVREALALREPGRQGDLIDATHSDLRKGPRIDAIEAKARERLLIGIDEALDIVSEWADVVTRLERHETIRAGQVNPVIEQLRKMGREARGPIGEAISAWQQSEDQDVAVAGTVAQLFFEEVLAAVDSGQEPARVERPPAPVLGWELLLASDVHLTGYVPSPLTSLTPEAVADVVNLVPDDPAVWVGAFKRRLTEKDYVGCDQIIAVLGDRSLDVPGDQLEQLLRELDDRFSVDLRSVERRFHSLESALARAQGERYLDEDEAQLAVAVLTDLRPYDQDEQPKRDLRSIEAGLDAIEASIDEGRTKAADQRRVRLDAVAGEQAAAITDVERITAQIERGDLAAADELLELLARREPLLDPPELSLRLEDFYPEVLTALDGHPIDRDAVRACERGGRLGPLDFGTLSDGHRAAATTGLEAWEHLDRILEVGKDEAFRALRSLLLVLGIEFRAHDRHPDEAGHGRGRSWLELSGVRQLGKAMVSDLGSQAAGHYRLLVIREPVSADRVVEWVDQDTSGKPIIVLYQGTLPVGERRELAKTLHRKSHIVAVVVDEPAFLFLATHWPESRVGDFERTMRLTLPFTGINPFKPFSLGQVPPEMFYGRKKEIDAVLDPDGPSFVYGGRQLGKSALLRSAARQFPERTSEGVAVYVDLNYEGVGTFREAGDIWEVLVAALVGQGLIDEPPKRPKVDAFDWFEQQVTEWLSGSAHRRLLVLLDESDRFLDKDAQTEFAVTQRLRGLTDDSGRRFKVVLAGLHLVQRFERMPNQPLAHLTSSPVVIGPLDPQSAYDLIQRPLDALGYRFEDDDLVTRILAYTNFQASIIQLVGQRLTQHLLARPVTPTSPPYLVTDQDLNQVFAKRDLIDEIRRRFEWTINLDDRYSVIAYTVALQARDEGSQRGMTAAELRAHCEVVWVEGFSQLAPDEMTAYLTEMVGLGVLAQVHGKYRLRSPNVLALLGTDEEILDRLTREFNLPEDFDLSSLRRPQSSTGIPSPLTATQDAELVRSGAHLVVATDLCRAGDVLGSLIEASGVDPADMMPIATSAEPIVNLLNDTTKAPMRLGDLRGAAADEAATVIDALAAVESDARSSTVVLLGPEQLPAWQKRADERLRSGTVFVRRWDELGLLTWCRSRDIQLSPPEAREALDATGGWPVFIDLWLDRRRAGETPDAATKDIRAELGKGSAKARWLHDAGLRDGSDLLQAWSTLAAWGELTRDEWLGEVAEWSDEPAVVIEQIELLHLVDVRGREAGDPVLMAERCLARVYAEVMAATGG